ncbi:gliding motility-associated C-terminal domain-containing protein [Ferruginibacter paludis]|uniref:gliding motility-associated C-terminal domain-containing protein n=1 Tax=Ferruginibacter paludis TaxID=1310417 RepID=UPI0025B4AC69|nr:gliding motility-associated C-terminal domain-containing protein [Ferruginibacter paludis]MDN3657423.1 gliding motility-associated C-terminal domain-containing protein [Ferruginibacter paludis]
MATSGEIKLLRQSQNFSSQRPDIRRLFNPGPFFNQPVNGTAQSVQKTNILLERYSHIPSVLSPGDEVSTCFDTSLRLNYSIAGKWFAPAQLTKTRDGNILISGFELATANHQTDAHLVKCNQLGDTLWSRRIRAGYPGYMVDIYKTWELSDNTLLLAGDIELPMPFNGREDLLLIKMSASGDLIWQKTFKTTAWNIDTTRGSMEILDCRQDENGDIYLCGDVKIGGTHGSGLAFKMDANGNIVWSTTVTSNFTPILCGINVTSSKVTFLGSESGFRVLPIGIDVDKTSGHIIAGTQLDPVSGDWSLDFRPNEMIKLNNGNLALTGRGITDEYQFASDQRNVNSGYIELTTDLDFVQSYVLRSVFSQYGYQTVTTMFADGSGAFARLGYATGLQPESLYGSFKNGQVLKQRFIPHPDQYVSWTSNFLPMDDGGQIIVNFVGDNKTSSAYTEFMRMHNSDTTGSCLGSDTTAVIMEKELYEKNQFYFQVIDSNVLSEDLHPFEGISNDAFTILSNCKQVSFCDSLRLSVSKDTVCVGTPVTINIHKNKECGAVPSWSYEATAVSFLYQQNDTTATAIINQPWQGVLRATISGCRLLQDSVRLTVLQSPGLLNLGTDTVICPGNTVLLNAKKGYTSYKWQNGSTDSVFPVKAPGIYYVTVTDACQGTFSDTVYVAGHSPISFDIGADTSICNKENITLKAPAAFLHYHWTGENINNDTLQYITAMPTISSWFKVTAEKTPGCFTSDSLFVTVKKTPSIQLGNDTSFCANQQLVLDAGPGFSSYEWNTGQQQQWIKINQPGSFSIRAVFNGCYVYDTLQVTSVYPMPVFSLGPDTSLCQGQNLLLHVSLPQGNFLWSNGSAANMFNVTGPGIYWLKATQQGCSTMDTLQVTYTSLPIVQLGKDSPLCEGQTMLLNATNTGATYIWQDGSTAATYSVKNQGLYAVTVSLGHCSVADTIALQYRPLPLFTLGRDTFMCKGQQLLLRPTINTSANFLWQDGSHDPTFTVIKEGIYSLQTSNSCGSYFDSITIMEGNCIIEMPSAFTPNGDGLNDVFKVKYPFTVQQYFMTVYNRFGEKVFETSQIGDSWDGKSKGQLLPQSSYVWLIRFTDDHNKVQTLKGTVLLIR